MIEWKVSDPCRVIYSADGLEYEAIIDSIDGEGEERYAIVHFVDYPDSFQVSCVSKLLVDLVYCRG